MRRQFDKAVVVIVSVVITFTGSSSSDSSSDCLCCTEKSSAVIWSARLVSPLDTGVDFSCPVLDSTAASADWWCAVMSAQLVELSLMSPSPFPRTLRHLRATLAYILAAVHWATLCERSPHRWHLDGLPWTKIKALPVRLSNCYCSVFGTLFNLHSCIR